MRKTTLGIDNGLLGAALAISLVAKSRKSSRTVAVQPKPKHIADRDAKAREIREWNEAVDRRKAEKKARNLK